MEWPGDFCPVFLPIQKAGNLVLGFKKKKEFVSLKKENQRLAGQIQN